MNNSIQNRLGEVNWEAFTSAMHSKGYAIIPNLITEEECATLKMAFANETLFRKTVVMERYRFGVGTYKYYNYPLPTLIQAIRTCIYPYLAPIANHWFSVLNIAERFPVTHEAFLEQCQQQNQDKATVLILKYGAGGYNTLHQDLYGGIYFPIQIVLFLSEPNKDYSGGEFVMTEQVPRAQSKAIVIQPKQGDVLAFTTNSRPIKGVKGYYRVNMKHGVSTVHSGERYTLGIIFHDALS